MITAVLTLCRAHELQRRLNRALGLGQIWPHLMVERLFGGQSLPSLSVCHQDGARAAGWFGMVPVKDTAGTAVYVGLGGLHFCWTETGKSLLNLLGMIQDSNLWTTVRLVLVRIVPFLAAPYGQSTSNPDQNSRRTVDMTSTGRVVCFMVPYEHVWCFHQLLSTFSIM